MRGLVYGHVSAACCVAALLFSVCDAKDARAQPAPKPAAPAAPGAVSPADMAEAKLRFDEGIRYGDAGDHEAARLKFNQAWALLKSPSILYNLARAESLSAGHLVDAYEHYRQFSKLPPDPKITDAQRQHAADSMFELSKKITLFDVDAAGNAKVTIDGRQVDIANPVVATPGSHTLESTIEGKSVKVVTIDGPAGAYQKVKLTDEPTRYIPIAPSPPPQPANAGGAGTGEPPKEHPASFWSAGRAVGTGLFIVGLAGVATGIVFHFSAAKSEDDATNAHNALPDPKDSACNNVANQAECDKLRTSVDSQHSKEGLRTAFLIGGGAFTVAGVVVFLVSGPGNATSEKPSRGALHVIPILSAKEQGMALSGRF